MVYAFAADFQVLPPALLLAITLIPYLTFFFIPVSVKKLEVVVFTFLKELLPGYFM